MHRFFFPMLIAPNIKLAIFGASFAGANLLGVVGIIVIVASFAVCEFCRQSEKDELEAA